MSIKKALIDLAFHADLKEGPETALCTAQNWRDAIEAMLDASEVNVDREDLLRIRILISEAICEICHRSQRERSKPKPSDGLPPDAIHCALTSVCERLGTRALAFVTEKGEDTQYEIGALAYQNGVEAVVDDIEEAVKYGTQYPDI